jgi:hypothetical protein
MEAEVLRALRFINDFKITSSEWRENGKAARSAPEKWNQFRMSGPDGSITISKEVQIKVREFTEIGPQAAHGGTMYVLNDKGKQVLSN